MSMRERIARALAPLEWHRMDTGRDGRLSASRREWSLRKADAVLDAITNPTVAMEEIGDDEWDHGIANAAEIYRAMIQAARNGK